MESIWQTFVATLPGIRSYFAAIAVFFIAERFFPAERNQSLRDQFFNARYTLLFLILTPFVVLWPVCWQQNSRQLQEEAGSPSTCKAGVRA